MISGHKDEAYRSKSLILFCIWQCSHCISITPDCCGENDLSYWITLIWLSSFSQHTWRQYRKTRQDLWSLYPDLLISVSGTNEKENAVLLMITNLFGIIERQNFCIRFSCPWDKILVNNWILWMRCRPFPFMTVLSVIQLKWLRNDTEMTVMAFKY